MLWRCVALIVFASVGLEILYAIQENIISFSTPPFPDGTNQLVKDISVQLYFSLVAVGGSAAIFIPSKEKQVAIQLVKLHKKLTHYVSQTPGNIDELQFYAYRNTIDSVRNDMPKAHAERIQLYIDEIDKFYSIRGVNFIKPYKDRWRLVYDALLVVLRYLSRSHFRDAQSNPTDYLIGLSRPFKKTDAGLNKAEPKEEVLYLQRTS